MIALSLSFFKPFQKNEIKRILKYYKAFYNIYFKNSFQYGMTTVG